MDELLLVFLLLKIWNYQTGKYDATLEYHIESIIYILLLLLMDILTVELVTHSKYEVMMNNQKNQQNSKNEMIYKIPTHAANCRTILHNNVSLVHQMMDF
jgi:hypothetical protein